MQLYFKMLHLFRCSLSCVTKLVLLSWTKAFCLFERNRNRNRFYVIFLSFKKVWPRWWLFLFFLALTNMFQMNLFHRFFCSIWKTIKYFFFILHICSVYATKKGKQIIEAIKQHHHHWALVHHLLWAQTLERETSQSRFRLDLFWDRY